MIEYVKTMDDIYDLAVKRFPEYYVKKYEWCNDIYIYEKGWLGERIGIIFNNNDCDLITNNKALAEKFNSFNDAVRIKLYHPNTKI